MERCSLLLWKLDGGPTARELPPGLALGDCSFVLLPTENSGFPGQEGAESRRRGKRGGSREREEEEWEGLREGW